MSTDHGVNVLSDADKLVLIPPAVAGDLVRRLYAAPVIARRLLHPLTESEEEDQIRWSQARAHVDTFVTGELLVLPKERATKKRGGAYDMRTLRPVADEVWEFRCCEPPPGVRLFGRFYERDIFVVLGAEYREAIGRDEAIWNAIIDDTQRKWREIFGARPPLEGAYPGDYIEFHHLD